MDIKKDKINVCHFMSMTFLLSEIKFDIDINNEKIIDNRYGNINKIKKL
jgi:hypothetical protein